MSDEKQNALEEARKADKAIRKQDYMIMFMGCALVLLAVLIS